MKARDWNNGLNYIDPDLVEEFVKTSGRLELRRRRKKRSMLWLRIGAIAACLAILVASPFAIIPLLHPQDPVVTPLPGEIPIEHVQTSSGAPFFYGSENSIDGEAAEEIDMSGISVTARYVEALPDTYMFFDNWRQVQFRILKMETVKLLKGGSMVDEFYYMVPVQYMTDFSLYDCFVLRDMGQYSHTFAVLYNVTDECAESMDLTLFGYRSSGVFTDYLSGHGMMAFDANGIIDLRLWQSNNAWKDRTDSETEYFGPAYTLNQAEDAEAKNAPYYEDYHVAKLESITDAAAKELDDLKSFKNGIFVPSGRSRMGAYTGFGGRRYIDGFATNEYLSFSAKEVSEDGTAVTRHTTARFTGEDMNRLPDLASAVASVKTALEAGQITPPHIQDLSSKKLSKWAGLGVFGWYAKTDDGVIGIIRINWRYEGDDEAGWYRNYFDDAYYVIEYGADTAVPMDRDALLERIGNCETTYIYTGMYNEAGKAYLSFWEE